MADHITKLLEVEQEQKQQKQQEQQQQDQERKRLLEQQAALAAGDGVGSALQTLALAGLQCPIAHGTELWGNALVWGDSHKTKRWEWAAVGLGLWVRESTHGCLQEGRGCPCWLRKAPCADLPAGPTRCVWG